MPCELFSALIKRDDVFSLGVCNGCQLMCKLGWVRGKLIENKSGRFESRFSNIKVLQTDNIFFNNLDINVKGTLNILEFARKKGISKFIFCPF